MSTKFYINNITPSPIYIPTTWYGGWNYVTSSPNYTVPLDPISFGGAIVSFNDNAPYSQFISPQRCAIFGAVSRPLLPQTINGTIDFVLGVAQYYTSNNAITRIHVYVANVTANTVFATLLNQYEETGVIWFQSTSAQIMGTKLVTLQTLTPCTIPSDGNVYRLVIEFGTTTTQPVGTATVSTRIEVGSRGGGITGPSQLPDLTVGEVTYQAKAGYFLFSADILLETMPVSNINKDSALAITIPYSNIIDTKGYELWYKYVGTVNDVISIFSCNSDPTRSSSLTVWCDNAGGIFMKKGVNKAPLEYPVKIGVTVYFQLYPTPYLPGNTEQFSIVLSPTTPVQAGDLLILNDDGSQNLYDSTVAGFWPAIWFVPATGDVRRADAHYTTSELGACLSNGKWAVVDQNNSKIFIYDKPPGLAELTRSTIPDTNYPQTFGTDFKNFYVVTWDSPLMPMYKINDSGMVDSRVWHIPYVDIGYTSGDGGQGGFGLSRDGLIAYYGHNVDNGPCRRHDMVNDVELLPPLPLPTYTGRAYRAGEVIVLKDNTILCNFHRIGADVDNRTVHYAPNGTILHIIEHGNQGELHHITHSADDDPDKFWAWNQPYSGIYDNMNRLSLIQISTGVILQDWGKHIFSLGGASYGDVPCGGSERFGAASSCPLMIMMNVALPDISGIYYVNSNKTPRHDSYYNNVENKIPDPTAKLGYLGE